VEMGEDNKLYWVLKEKGRPIFTARARECISVIITIIVYITKVYYILTEMCEYMYKEVNEEHI
jgi:hypothetical protein